MLKNAKCPIIIAGGGVHYSEAWDELRAFSDNLGTPVVETNAGKGAIREPSSLLLGGGGVTGNPAAGKVMSEADLVISVGTRLTDFVTGSQAAFNNPEVKFLSIYVCSRDVYKQGALPIVADAREGLPALSRAALDAETRPAAAYINNVASIKSDWENRVQNEVYQPTAGELMSQAELLGILNEESQPGDTVVAASGSVPADLLELWDVGASAACHIEFGFSCMGYEIPAALGVRMAQPECEVYVFIGDGAYLMNPTEIVTSRQEELKITIILSGNHGFQCIRNLPVAKIGRSFGNEFRKRDLKSDRLEGKFVCIDFAQNAESMGARTWKVKTSCELRNALREAREEKTHIGHRDRDGEISRSSQLPTREFGGTSLLPKFQTIPKHKDHGPHT
jgi:3D-(3,5/4)-trihydroxycyclohexane-1,2-dione acylhydrolase (decyclizing)